MDINAVRARITPDQFASFLGIKVLEANSERALVGVELEDHYLNIHGGAHGGRKGNDNRPKADAPRLETGIPPSRHRTGDAFLLPSS